MSQTIEAGHVWRRTAVGTVVVVVICARRFGTWQASGVRPNSTTLVPMIVVVIEVSLPLVVLAPRRNPMAQW